MLSAMPFWKRKISSCWLPKMMLSSTSCNMMNEKAPTACLKSKMSNLRQTTQITRKSLLMPKCNKLRSSIKFLVDKILIKLKNLKTNNNKILKIKHNLDLIIFAILSVRMLMYLLTCKRKSKRTRVKLHA